MNRIEIDVTTGEQQIIPLTAEELAQAQVKQAELDAMQAEIAAKEQADKDAKTSALAKLEALGLTDDEINALVG
jgi:F0F1-type ATP synthase gamma subunit